MRAPMVLAALCLALLAYGVWYLVKQMRTIIV